MLAKSRTSIKVKANPVCSLLHLVSRFHQSPSDVFVKKKKKSNLDFQGSSGFGKFVVEVRGVQFQLSLALANKEKVVLAK